MKEIINQTLYDCCITATAAIKEIGISRNAFYLFADKHKDKYELFLKAHQDDFRFTKEKLQKAIEMSGLTQLEVSAQTDIHNVTLNLFLKGKLRPSRASGDYERVLLFCDEWGIN